MMNDQDALVLAVRGRAEGFQAIFDKYGQYLFTLALRILKDKYLAEDAVQETFSAAFRNIGKFRGDARLKTWLYTILYRSTLDIIDKRKSEVPANDFEISGGLPNYTNIETKCDVREVLNRLPERDRAVLIMTYWDDLTCREIGEVMGLTENHVRILLFRARERFEKVWPGKTFQGGTA